MTFNILAQCYTRSDFFPSVNPKAALKWKNRSPKIVGKLFILVYIYAYVYEPVHAYVPVPVLCPLEQRVPRYSLICGWMDDITVVWAG